MGIELNKGRKGPPEVEPHTERDVPANDAPVLPGSPDQLQATNKEGSVYTSSALRLVISKSCQS